MTTDGSLSRYTPDRPLVLLTDYPPDTAGGGAVILRSLLTSEDRSRMFWMSPTPCSDAKAAGPNVLTLRSGSAGRGRRSIGLDSTVYAKSLAHEVMTEARARHAQAIWVVMHNAAVAIAARLIRSSGFPIHLTVHDDPAFANALRSKRYLALVPWIERDFSFALKRTASIDVISQGMADRYRCRYGVESVIIHRALSESISPSKRYDRVRLGLRVGILGSTYSYEQLPILARAVELTASRLGVPGRLLVIGKSHGDRLRIEMKDRVEVEVAGHVSEVDAVALLRDCFAMYLNYPFGRRDGVLSQTSFPTKLSTYIQAARPLLLHVPPDSSVMPLVKSDGFATLWSDLDPGHGAQALTSAWNRPENHESRHDPAEQVRLAYYDPIRNRSVLFGALNTLRPSS